MARGKGESEASVRRANAAERQRQALELRKAGAGYQQIADKLGFASPSGAHKAVLSAIRKTLQEPADDVRKLEVERLDKYLLALAPQIANGNQGAIDRALRIQERRARLLGLDAPAKVEIKDWREEARKEGVDPDVIFSKLVATLTAEMAGRGDSGSADSSAQ